MFDSQPTKRARANTAGDAHDASTPAEQDHLSQTRTNAEQLDKASLVELVAQAVRLHPDIENLLDSTLHRIHEREGNRVISFEGLSGSIWKSLNVTHARLSGSNQYDMAGEVCREINETVESIAARCGPSANPKTRFNGLSVLRKIGKSIAYAVDTLGHEVHKQYQWDTSLEEAMAKIIRSMEREERESIRWDEGPDALWFKLLELQDLAEDFCIFVELNDAVALLEDEDDEDDDDDDDEDEDVDEVEDFYQEGEYYEEEV
ncbi:hypothetical protein ASPZODRAFT_136126 [Penicilliopsis zonata CBS 506.65]|uniref:Uncharacterized protein n=1 Tax=Penicilliopsis zonata CBS 506.65 TaxID=1073090 RepID=A0A1L9S919_9EURO|nr:hypothetical protein ASPZODRAFT_136126 [Penicilliopsis zonata CBS 506.65]OJJ43672.1 hypothetical protein ASPZODRAFT_136126 [Penicilliopsis zonata CBS 506.65]